MSAHHPVPGHQPGPSAMTATTGVSAEVLTGRRVTGGELKGTVKRSWRWDLAGKGSTEELALECVQAWRSCRPCYCSAGPRLPSEEGTPQA